MKTEVQQHYTVTHYICDHCNTRWTDKDSATRCEEKCLNKKLCQHEHSTYEFDWDEKAISKRISICKTIWEMVANYKKEEKGQ